MAKGEGKAVSGTHKRSWAYLKEKYPETIERELLRRQIRKQMAEELAVMATFHAANMFFWDKFVREWLKRNKLTKSQFALMQYMYILGKSGHSPSDSVSGFLHPSERPLLLGKICNRIKTYLSGLTARGLTYKHQVPVLKGRRKTYYQLTDEGKKLVHKMGRDYRATITAYEQHHGSILWAEIYREIQIYK